MSDELKALLLLVCHTEASSGSNCGRERGGKKERKREKINLPFTESSLVCLLSSDWVKPNWAASYTKRKVKSINMCVRSDAVVQARTYDGWGLKGSVRQFEMPVVRKSPEN